MKKSDVGAHWFRRTVGFAIATAALFAACSSPQPSDDPVPPEPPPTPEPTTQTVAAKQSDPLPNGGIVASTSQMIGVEGGTLQLNDATLSFPPGALPNDVMITLSEANAVPHDGGIPGSPIYILEPEGLQFPVPITLRIPFQGDPSSGVVRWWDDNQHDAFPVTSDNFDGEYVTVSNTHASKIAAAYGLLDFGKKAYDAYDATVQILYPCGQGGAIKIGSYCYSCDTANDHPVESGGKVICCGANGSIAFQGECHSCPATYTAFVSGGQVQCCSGSVVNGVCLGKCPSEYPAGFPRADGATVCCPAGTQGITANSQCAKCPGDNQTMCSGAKFCCADTATCGDNACVPKPASCKAPTTACGNACVNVLTSTANCGACANACSAKQRCINGACLNAPDVAWLDASNAAAIVMDKTGAVSSWADQSTQNVPFATYGAAPPTYSPKGGPNGKPAIAFMSNLARLGTVLQPTRPQMTLFVVYRMNDISRPWATIIEQDHDNFWGLRKTELGGAAGNLNFYVANNNDGPSIPLEMGVWHLVTAVQSATTTTVYSSPALAATWKQGPIPMATAGVAIGNSGSLNEPLYGDIAELRMYGSALGDADRGQIEEALRTKWGLPRPYKLSGAASGLKGSLTLVNYGTTVTVTQDGPFTFPAPVYDQGPYEVLIDTPPPGQQCTVKNGSGKVTNKDVTNVAVTCQ